jgi:hypothetical protein
MGIRQRRIIVHFKYQYQAKLTQYRTFQISISSKTDTINGFHTEGRSLAKFYIKFYKSKGR